MLSIFSLFETVTTSSLTIFLRKNVSGDLKLFVCFWMANLYQLLLGLTLHGCSSSFFMPVLPSPLAKVLGAVSILQPSCCQSLFVKVNIFSVVSEPLSYRMLTNHHCLLKWMCHCKDMYTQTHTSLLSMPSWIGQEVADKTVPSSTLCFGTASMAGCPSNCQPLNRVDWLFITWHKQWYDR